jgi:hypothetical protein
VNQHPASSSFLQFAHRAVAKSVISVRSTMHLTALGISALALVVLCSAAKAQTNEWVWIGGSSTIPLSCNGHPVCGQPAVIGTLGVPAAGNVPGGRYGEVSWTGTNGHLWLLGGNGFSSPGFESWLNDLWEFNPTTNEWAWMSGSAVPDNTGGKSGLYGTLGTPAAGNIPGSRFLATGWTDLSGNLWLFGGYGRDSAGLTGRLNDLWEFSPNSNEWTWMGGSNTLGAKYEQPGVYGNLGVPATGNVPGGRMGAVSWTDTSGNFWLFGGDGADSAGNSAYLNDLWEFNPVTNEWAWISGSETVTSIYAVTPGVYGTQGTPAPGNIPGGRSYSATWIDKSGHLWLFGGDAVVQFNDLWEFDPATKEWTWMSGSSTPNQPGVYGTLGVPATGNVPGARYTALSWMDTNGCLWLFGGRFYDSAGNAGYSNDLWVFNPVTEEWAWMGGGKVVDQSGVYGTLGVPAATNVPGARFEAVSWTDTSGNFWLSGGAGFDSVGIDGLLNDLWVYHPSAPLSPTATPTFSPAAGTYNSVQTVTITDATANATIYYTTNGTTPTTNSTKYTGPITVSVTETIKVIANASGYSTSAAGSATYTLPKATPALTVISSSSAITTTQALTVTVDVNGGSGNPTPTGSVTLSGGGYTSASTALSSGAATINVPAGTLATGSDTLTATYTPDSTSSPIYNSVSGSTSVTVTTAPSFALSGTAVAVSPGATTGNRSTITITPAGGFTGSVTLTASITSSPSSAQYLPTLSFGSTTPVSITSTTAGTATLTISTTAPTSAALIYPKRPGAPWYAAGGATLTLACLLLFGIPARRRSWRTMLGMLCLLVGLSGGVLACGGGGGGGGGGGSGNPGTTAGTYTVTVTGTASSLTESTTVTVTVN